MEHTAHHPQDDDAAAQAVSAELKAALQAALGADVRVVRLLELTPLMSEALLENAGSGARTFARCYRVPPSKHGMVQQLWRDHAGRLSAAAKHLPQKAQGLKTIGSTLAYVAADVPGLDLETYLRMCGPLRPEGAVRMCVHLVRTLERLEELHCRHNQIHPGNITVTPEGLPVLKWAGLADFENALAEALGVTELIDATYAAPEQLEGKPGDTATDIYQLGLILFRMVAGRPPFQGTYAEVKEGHLRKALPNPKATNKTVTTGLNRVLMTALAKDPGQRFPSLSDMKTALSYLQTSVERTETLAGSDRVAKIKEKDKAQIAQLLRESETQFQSGDHTTALRTLDHVFVLAGRHGEAARLHQQIWEALYGAGVKKLYGAALKKLEAGDKAGALADLASCLGVMPRFKQGLKVQADIFASVEDHAPVLPGAIDPGAYLGKAVEVKAANPPLAAGLWSQVLLLAEPEEEDARKHLAFQKQLALRGLKGLQDEAPAAAAAAPPPPPPPQTPLPPDDSLGFGEDFDEIFDTPTDMPPPPETDQPTRSAPAADLDDFADAAAEPVAPQRDAAPKKRRSPALVLGAVAVVALLVAGGLFFKLRADAAARDAVSAAAYAAADKAEKGGDWDGALSQWDALLASAPDYRDTADRQERLKLKVYERKHEINNRLEAARGLLEAGLIHEPGDDGKNALQLLAEVRERDSANAEAGELLDRIRTAELTRARELLDADKPAEAQALYASLTAVDPMFREADLEARLSEWVEKTLVAPGLAKLDRALERKQWDEAREISDALEEVLPDPARLTERWDALWTTYEEAYLQARADDKPERELAALDVMVRIRPDDTELSERRDKLNRDLNLAKITDLEQRLDKVRGSSDYLQTASLANQLASLDSKNEKAEYALSSVRQEITREIDRLKNTHPRAAIAKYDMLLKVSNWKSYREARATLRTRINQFDSGVTRLKRDQGEPYAGWADALGAFLEKYPDMATDDAYRELANLKTALTEEAERLNQLQQWEARTAKDMATTYEAALAYLNKNDTFRFRYGKNRVGEWIAAYRGKIEAYDSGVKLVIVGATDLPFKRSGLKRAPTTYCELVTAGQTFKTEEVKDTSPRYNHIAAFKAKPGAPLVFTVYEVNRKAARAIGTITLPSVPKDQKNLVLKPDDGDWSLTINVDRER